jgi:hypothetical protein
MEKRLHRLGGIQIDQFSDEVEFLDEGKTKQWSLMWRDGMSDVQSRQLHFPDQRNQPTFGFCQNTFCLHKNLVF